MAITTTKKTTKKTKVIPTAKVIGPGEIAQMNVIETEKTVTQHTVDANKTIELPLLETLGIIKSFEGLESQLVDEVKNAAIDAGAKRITSANYNGVISGGGPGRKINIERFFKLCKKKKIKTSEINAVLSVGINKINFLSEQEITTVCDMTANQQISLTVTRKADAPPLKVMEAIQTVAHAGGLPELMPKKK